MLIPIISMCLSADAGQNIAIDNKPINFYAPPELKKLDYSFLRSYVRNMSTVDSMIVIGTKTLDDMLKVDDFDEIIKEPLVTTITVSKDGIYRRINSMNSVQIASDYDSNDSLYNKIMAYAIDKKIKSIYVLGGAKIYDSFINNANEVYLGHYSISFREKDHKNVKTVDVMDQLYADIKYETLISTYQDYVRYTLYKYKGNA